MADDFPTTQWSLVLSAARESGDVPHGALATLCEAYWFPLYAYVCRRGHSPEDAQDLVQIYFVRLVEKRFIDAADPRSGRFRAFLLHTMKQFLTDQHRRDHAAKRGGGEPLIRIDTTGVGETIADSKTPEDEFERQWALAVVDRALDKLEQDASSRGRQREFGLLSSFLTDSAPRPSYREIAAELGTTEGAVKVAVLRLRRSFGRALRDVVGQTVFDPDEIDDEIRRLLTALA